MYTLGMMVNVGGMTVAEAREALAFDRADEAAKLAMLRKLGSVRCAW